MKQSINRFLQFNGKTLLFLAKDGTNWIALKPICEALGIEYTRTFKNVSADPIIGPALAKQPMQVSVQLERAKLEKVLRQNPEFLQFESLKAMEARIGKSLKEVEKDEIDEQLRLQI